MKISSLKLVYFSPTGTTKAILQAIAQGINCENVELLDITKPQSRLSPPKTSESELLIVGVPVYMGRVPGLLTEWFHVIKAQRTPAVCVVMYGNRVYEDALIELKDILSQCGCTIIAGAAYIGEHSFSCHETPIAKDRPDKADLLHAESLGQKIREKLTNISSIDKLSEVVIPGVHPYRGDSRLWTVDFIAVSDACTQCGICADVCPVGAINSTKSNKIDTKKCITCCACIKQCPSQARTMLPGLVKEASVRLHTLYPDRKEPEYFL